MNPLVIAIPVLVLLAGFVIFASLRRKEDARSHRGHLSRETRKRDRSSRKATPLLEGSSGKEVERAAQLARKGGELVPVSEPAPPRPVRRPRPRGDRRLPPPVPQPVHHRWLHPRPQRLRCRRAGVPLARRPAAASAPRSRSARSPTSRRPSPTATGSPTTPRVACGSRPTRRARSTRPTPPTAPPSSPAWRRASSPSTRSACTSAAASRPASPRSGSSAAATARSTTRSARTRAVPPLVGSTASPCRSAAARSSSTPAPSSRARRIGTNTTGQEAEGPHCVSGSGGH